MTRVYLRLAAGGVAVVALGYALAPHTPIGSLIDVPMDNIDQVHILRAIMGLYLGMVCFWFLGASRPIYARPAMMTVVFFMFGLALGRISSMVVDGLPSPFLIGATGVEIAAGIWGLVVLREPSSSTRREATVPRQ